MRGEDLEAKLGAVVSRRSTCRESAPSKRRVRRPLAPEEARTASKGDAGWTAAGASSHASGLARAQATPMRVLVLDNYDSFTWNLVQYLGELGATCEVVKNDTLGVERSR